MQWFRMYAEAIDDGKLRILAYEDRWHFVALLCLKAQGILDEKNKELRHQQICIKFGMDSVELEKTMKRLVTVGLVSESWQPLNWNKRQFVSDSSTPRVRAFRKRSRNVPETDQNRTEQIQNRTDTEKKKGASAPLVFPNGFAMREWEEWIAHRKTRRWPCDHRTLQKQIDTLNGHGHAEQSEMINRSINAGWQGIFPPRGAPRETVPERTWRPDPNNPEDNGPC